MACFIDRLRNVRIMVKWFFFKMNEKLLFQQKELLTKLSQLQSTQFWTELNKSPSWNSNLPYISHLIYLTMP